MNQKGEYILAGITTLLIAVAGVAFFDSTIRGNGSTIDAAPEGSDQVADTRTAADVPPASTENGTVKVQIDFGDGNTIEEVRDVSAPLDAREVVYVAAVAHRYSVRAGEKFLPVALGDIANEENGKKWTLYINGATATSLERVSVKSGDILVLKYE